MCASSSLIPRRQQARHHGPDPQRLGRAEAAGAARHRLRRGHGSYALSEREAGSDAAGMKTRARKDGNNWVLNGSKCWITNGGKSTWYTVMAVTDPEKKANGISAFMVHKDDPGFTVGPLEKKLGIKGSPTAELYFEDCTIPLDRIIGDEGTGFKTALQTLDHTRPTIAPRPSASPRVRSTRPSNTSRTASSSASRSARSRASSS